MTVFLQASGGRIAHFQNGGSELIAMGHGNSYTRMLLNIHKLSQLNNLLFFFTGDDEGKSYETYRARPAVQFGD